MNIERNVKERLLKVQKSKDKKNEYLETKTKEQEQKYRRHATEITEWEK